jgi:glycosyltransferase involved in cell wall biosynthesis
MKIAIITLTNRMAGGVETYLSEIIPELEKRGHKIGLWYQHEEKEDERTLEFKGLPSASISNLGVEKALENLKRWTPDIIYSQGLTSSEFEREASKIAPLVRLIHNYYGTCISGTKAFKFPVIQPCSRKFGWQCLLHYYPHRCGGLNPKTMWKEFRNQKKRLESLFDCKAILVTSEHMMEEYRKHGLDEQLHLVKNFIPQFPQASESPIQITKDNNRWRLLFLGRMEHIKGGQILLKILPRLMKELNRPISLIFAGDGPARKSWEDSAMRLQQKYSNLEIRFPGWIDGERRNKIFQGAHLLILPSLWPEPYGLVGSEAGFWKVPTVAFDVGGISRWLKNGVNGFLAPGNPPTADGLAETIIQTLNSPKEYERVCEGALAESYNSTIEGHLLEILSIFEKVAFESEVPK